MIATTVLMGVYNAPLAMLDQAISSIVGQSFVAFELLIVDDGSTVEEVRRHLEWRARRDARIRIAWEPHRGLTASLNRGLELARGTFIARQDADDWSEPDRLTRQYAFLTSHPAHAVCGSNVWTHQQDGRALWRTRLPLQRCDLLQMFPRANPFVHGATMFRREAAHRIGGYRETFRYSQDYDLFWRLTEQHEAANLPEALYHYRYTSGSISAARAIEQLRAHTAIRRLAAARQRGEMEDPPAELARATAELDGSRGVFRAQLKQADHMMLAGDYRKAAQSYLTLLGAHPANPLAWAKFARLGVFRAAPFLRETCFR